TVTPNSDGSLTLRGIAYRRENGTGPFALDVFYGQVSQEGQQISGTLLDGTGQSGHWSMIRVINDLEKAATITTQLLSPTSGAVTHWTGIVGKWPATFDIMPRPATGGWRARVVYHGITEELTVGVKGDGSLVFTGTSYTRSTGEGPFLLDTFYGQLSPD